MIALFDIDGTLTASGSIDGGCFVRAFDEVFGIRDVDDDWSRYQHSTDHGLTSEILRHALGREATDVEIEKHAGAFSSCFANGRTRFVRSEGRVSTWLGSSRPVGGSASSPARGRSRRGSN